MQTEDRHPLRTQKGQMEGNREPLLFTGSPKN